MERLKKEDRRISVLRDEGGGWLSPNKVATDKWSDGALDSLNDGLDHLGDRDNPYVVPVVIELLLGIDFPLRVPVFRILGVTSRGIWIDDARGRVSPTSVLIPWPAIFAVTIHGETPEAATGG